VLAVNIKSVLFLYTDVGAGIIVDAFLTSGVIWSVTIG